MKTCRRNQIEIDGRCIGRKTIVRALRKRAKRHVCSTEDGDGLRVGRWGHDIQLDAMGRCEPFVSMTSTELRRLSRESRRLRASDTLGETKTKRTTCAQIPEKFKMRVCLKRSGTPGPTITGPEAACKFLRAAKDADRESFYSIMLNPQNQIIGYEEVAKGSAAGVDIHPRELFKSAILSNAQGLLIAHNHPSGNPDPSQEDIVLTRRLVDAANMIGIPILDHIVIGSRCTSLREEMPSLFERAR